MKKLIYCALALAAGLFATSCQQENLEPVQGASTVTFTVNVPEVATKAIGDGSDINNLLYAVYRTEANNEQDAIELLRPEHILYCVNPLDPKGAKEGNHTNFVEGKAYVSLELIKNQKYIVLFWAQNEQTWVSGETFDLTNITYPPHTKDNPRLANSNKYEAFAGVAYIGEVTGSCSKNAELYRPFAQINLATNNPENYEVDIEKSKVTIENALPTFNVATMRSSGEATTVVYDYNANPDVEFNGYNHYVAMNYIFANPIVEPYTVKVTCTIDTEAHGKGIETVIDNVPVAQNYKTNIVGNLLTSDVDYTVTLKEGWYTPDQTVEVKAVSTAQELIEVFAELENNAEGESTNIKLEGDIDLNDLFAVGTLSTKAGESDPTLTIPAGKSLTLDLNSMKLSATSKQTGNNYNMLDVRGNLTVKNGTIEYKHEGDNMGWGNSTNIFNVTAGGVLNLEGVTAKNLGGSDMAFVAHLNNWGEVTLNADNCTLESSYIAVRVFNSGPDMNNVNIKNSTLKGKFAFWVHNYTAEDFKSESKAESQKALLNLNIYNQGNTFSPDVNGILYGFTGTIYSDSYGITKSVSEDGTEVTLGSLFEDGLIRRGVAGDEENTTIKKVVVEEGVAVLYDRTFRRFYALEEVVLPSTLTTIGAAGSGVFQSCTNLKNIVIPESVTVLGKGSFQECSSLESINIPSGVTRIEENALRATGLKSVEFHEGVTYFGAQAFRDCKQLKEVVIKAPEFEMEGNTFGITAAPFTQMTIYVANPAMKAYVESKLTDHAKTYIIVVGPEEVSDTEDLNTALADGKDVFLTADIAVANTEVGSNGYGATGISQLKGGTIDGNGKSISVNAWGTWDSAINTTGGTIKNVNVTGGMRGIFINHNSEYSEKVILQNVTIDGTIYTISCDQGTNKGLEAYNSTFKGWTSYAATIGTVKFDNCSFGEGQGYAFCRPYAATEFVNCAFETGFELDACAPVTFENCTLDGVALTAENLSTLVTENTTNATVK